MIEPHLCALSVGRLECKHQSDSVLPPVFAEREINKLLNLKPHILSSSRVHLGQVCKVFLCLWPSLKRTGCLRKVLPLYLSQPLVLEGLTARIISGRGSNGEHAQIFTVKLGHTPEIYPACVLPCAYHGHMPYALRNMPASGKECGPLTPPCPRNTRQGHLWWEQPSLQCWHLITLEGDISA